MDPSGSRYEFHMAVATVDLKKGDLIPWERVPGDADPVVFRIVDHVEWADTAVIHFKDAEFGQTYDSNVGDLWAIFRPAGAA